jgi:hypothetical protein
MFAIEDDFVGAWVVQNPVHRAVQLAPYHLLMLIYSVQRDERVIKSISLCWIPKCFYRGRHIVSIVTSSRAAGINLHTNSG